MNKLFFVAVLLLSYLFVNAQEFTKTSYPVFDGNNELAFPFAGGLQAPQLSSADLDRDGTDDLYLFDRAGNVSIPFRYIGPAGEANYEIDWSLIDSFPRPPLWVQLRDFNGDGVEDMFASKYTEGKRKSFTQCLITCCTRYRQLVPFRLFFISFFFFNIYSWKLSSNHDYFLILAC